MWFCVNMVCETISNTDYFLTSSVFVTLNHMHSHSLGEIEKPGQETCSLQSWHWEKTLLLVGQPLPVLACLSVPTHWEICIQCIYICMKSTAISERTKIGEKFHQTPSQQKKNSRSCGFLELQTLESLEPVIKCAFINEFNWQIKQTGRKGLADM